MDNKPERSEVSGQKSEVDQELKPEAPTPAANVKLAGEAEPLGAGPVTVGMATIGELPDEKSQRAGFYFPAAQQLTRLFPDRFKLLIRTGSSSDRVLSGSDLVEEGK